MIHCKQNGLEWLQFDHLTDIPKLKHGCFLRNGGKSEGPFASLNLSNTVGDEAKCVVENRQTVQKALDLPSLVTAQQCHGSVIWDVKGASVSESKKSDALVTASPNLGLLITHADCQAAIIYDPCHHVVANVHSGWRGSVQNIYSEVISWMRDRYGSSPADLLVGISPSLGPDKGEFIHYCRELPKVFWSFQVTPNFFDFWSISRWQLEECGVLPHHIEIAEMCTYSNPQETFSYRLNRITGRLGTVVSLF